MEVSSSTTIEPTRDERLTLYLVIVVFGTAIAAFGGGLAAMLLVTPFAIALPLGMRRRDDAVIDVRVTLDTQRCLEGDTVQGRIDVTGPPGTTIEVAIECPTTALTAPHDDPWAWHIAADVATPVGLPIDDRDEPLGALLARSAPRSGHRPRFAPRPACTCDGSARPDGAADRPRISTSCSRLPPRMPHSAPIPPGVAPATATTSPRSAPTNRATGCAI